MACSLERFNTSFHQKTSWVEEHCYKLLHGNKIEMNIIINNYNIHYNYTNTLHAFYMLFKIGDSNCFAPSCFCSLKTRLRYSTDFYKT